ncbi:ABC-type transport system involved in resistance to organic solvents, auxiliary component [Thioflavicoccus mobilis 8321]|uniref:ABC-type transport system involved in resistance to organic solvents, auxiliary component n=1 Tax=Thioflavicoccus mobilis 8321 TaxID=765912 RepID=L0H081_9GAMM|nr:ABC transporter substrate-binding protein [Thioflavicoccus mobilis]AGA91462.1 ABC-type transport system involved in resistance to organic solvents, auxiliary component [Thioflavicoccus mobilis 8321]
MKRVILLLATLFLASGVAQAAPSTSATALAKETSEQMLQVLEERRDEIERRPQLIYQLVDKIVLPHFDFERITRTAVGRYWREASTAQRRALTEGFREVLVRTYARALLSYSGETIHYLPERKLADDRVTVSTEVRNPGGATIRIDYRLYATDGTWKVYDVIVDNVSLVANYRGTFANIIRSSGIDGLIDRLGEMNAAGEE